MTTPKFLPARPSLESLRKQAKKLVRSIAAGDAVAISRAREQLTNVELPLSLRDAQLVIAREYGYAGWRDLTEEVAKRLGNDLEWAVTQARSTHAHADISGGSRPRCNKFSMWRSPSPSSIITSTSRTSFSRTAQTSTPIEIPTSQPASCTT